MGLSLPHILIIVLLLVVLFGAKNFPEKMENLAKGFKSFKHGMKDEDEAKTAARTEPQPDIRTLPRQDEIRRADGSRVADVDSIDQDHV
jgi:sec-independent protein translocase protein TatA